MLLVGLIIVGIVAAGLLGLLLQTRSTAAEARAQADQRESELRSERETLTADKAKLEDQLSSAKAENGRLNEQNSTAAAEVRRLGGELDEARSEAVEQSGRIEHQATRIASLEAEADTMTTKLVEAQAAKAAAEARLTGIAIADAGIDTDQASPEALWALELIRSERTWRTSVALSPDAPEGPFTDADNPARLAVEIEASALRENVGASITVDWQAGVLSSPAHAHLVVRMAQELLEAAARSPEPSRLEVLGSDDEVTLSLLTENPDDEADEAANIILPRVASDLVELRHDAGASLAVKAG